MTLLRQHHWLRYGIICLLWLGSGMRGFAQEPPVLPPQDVEKDSLEEEVMPPVVEEDPFEWAGDGMAMSGVYEVIIGVSDAEEGIRYFKELGYRLIQTGYMTAIAAEMLYGVPSAVKSYRLQNGNVDSHGLIRLVVWEKPLSQSVGYSPPGSVGTRLLGMVTTDIFNLYDIYQDARESGEIWLPTLPFRQSLTQDTGPAGFYDRQYTYREMAVYGPWVNHLFTQRYGYTVPGYGNIHLATRLNTSEIVHHDFWVQIDSMAQLSYLERILGFIPDQDPYFSGDFHPSAAHLYHLKPGEAFWAQDYSSPNNIGGKLRFFVPLFTRTAKPLQPMPGRNGVCAHTFYTPHIDLVWNAAVKEKLRVTPISPNEFGERCFIFRGPEGTTWQVIHRTQPPMNEPIFYFNIQLLDE